MKQIALEWLIENHFGSIENCTPDFRNKIKQAKEMEKQQQDEFAIGFAEWLVIQYNQDTIYSNYKTEELLEIYKKEKGL